MVSAADHSDAPAEAGTSASDPLARIEAKLDRFEERFHKLEKLMKEAEGGLATGADIVDDLLGKLVAKGIDPGTALMELLGVLGELHRVLVSPEFQALMNSGVLDPCTLEVIGAAGRALVQARADKPKQAGLFGALAASGDADIQRSLGFLIEMGRHFGDGLEKLPAPNPCSQA